MKILLVYSSLTGNTRRVAEAIGEELGLRAIPVKERPSANGYDLVIAGFWVDKGTADASMRVYLQDLHDVPVALFATLGADPTSEHARMCMSRAAALLGAGSQLLGQFICQGRVSEAMVEQMKKMFPPGHPHALTPAWLQRLDAARPHPDSEDFQAARAYFRELLTRCSRELA